MNRGIDSNKLALHHEIIAKWKKGEKIWPVYVEMSPTSICNYKCTYCALDFFKKGDILCLKTVHKIIDEMLELGVKSIMFAGEGEPLVNPMFVDMAIYAKTVGIDVALTTNGSLMTKEIAKEILPVMSWVKVSFNSVVPSTFCKVSGLEKKAGMYALAHTIQNIYEAVDIRNVNKYNCDIGVQMLLLEDNYRDILSTIVMARELGVDYFVLKPYSQHPSSKNKNKLFVLPEGDISYFEKMSTDKFKVVIRKQTEKRNYERCYAMPFWSYVSSNGDVWVCSSHMPDEKYRLGNIYMSTLKDIWSRENSVTINTINCREGCRMDSCNRYLQMILNSDKHVNFI